VAAAGAILSAVYMLYMYQRLFYGRNKQTENLEDLNLQETLIGGTFAVLILLLGIMPMTVLRSMEPKIQQFSLAAQPATTPTMANSNKVKLP
jgi:NADH-quinone oxidoreductase subunit M